MKKTLFSLTLLSFIAFGALAQNVKFTKVEQTEVQKILGKDLTALLDSKGNLAIVKPTSISEIKSDPNGVFLKPSTLRSSNTTFACNGKWCINKKTTKATMIAILGEQRFKQLLDVMKRKGISETD